ncbi:MAG TPA: hypothetical protein VGI39_06365 [Polyangiaceae bacterium]
MTRRRGALRSAPLFLLASLAFALPAAAQEDRAGAAALFTEAGKLIDAGQTAAACAKYEESLRLYDGVNTRYFLADCDERLGKMASAWGLFLEVAMKARAQGDEAKEAKANERAAAVKGRVSHVMVVVEGARPAGFEVRRDGVALGRAEWGQALPVDPGEHVFEASAPAKKGWSAHVTVDAPERIPTVVVPMLEGAPEAVAATPAPGASGETAAEAPRRSGTGQRIAGVAIGGAGVVALGVSTALAIAAKGRFDDASTYCNGDRCDRQGMDIRADAVSRANVATVIFGVGLAAIVGGGALWLTAPKAGSGSDVAVAITPTMDTARHGSPIGGVALTGSF